MPVRCQLFTLVLGVIGLSGCTHSLSDAEFIRCWGGDLQRNGTAEIRFQAVAYPRGRTISATEQCPQLRLILDFEDSALPPGFHLFDMMGENPFESKGIGGTALVAIKSRDGIRMVVTVTRFIDVRMLSEEEKRGVLLESR